MLNFVKRALRCLSSQQAKHRARWEQLRAGLRRKEGYSFLAYFGQIGFSAMET